MTSLRVLISHNRYQIRGGEDAVVEGEAVALARAVRRARGWAEWRPSRGGGAGRRPGEGKERRAGWAAREKKKEKAAR